MTPTDLLQNTALLHLSDGEYADVVLMQAEDNPLQCRVFLQADKVSVLLVEG